MPVVCRRFRLQSSKGVAYVSTKVLVTGAAGAVGRAVCAELRARGHWVRGLDLRPSEHVDDSHVGSIQDPEVVRLAMDGIQRVVHLAAQPDRGDFLTQIVPNNYVGLHHVLEAAVEHVVQRLVLASTMQVVSGLLRRERMVRLADGVAPDNHYALSKVLAEEMGRMYARIHGLSVLAVRLAWMPRDPQAVEHMHKSPRARAFFISPRDAGRCFACCIEAGLDGKPGSGGEAVGEKGGRYGVLFAAGRVLGEPAMDMASARTFAGYEPRDTFPQGAPGEPDRPDT
jgi:uronate dehydrogenase